ncbi:vgr related protein [Novosphingobium sp.]|uniref:vgr related protein n=1 Tax=Novosphingobium sp. TaxID=1874826 RepID=UPI00263340D6|nr:vgr related protein [Novosphingobium sp.]
MRSAFGAAIDCARVTIRRRRWWWFQPRHITMAPMGHLHFHPAGDGYCDDFSQASPDLQGHFIHEMTHVWQAQTRGRWYVVALGAVQRRYSYRLQPGKRLEDYGIEQQAEIVRHAFMARMGWFRCPATEAAILKTLVSFGN